MASIESKSGIGKKVFVTGATGLLGSHLIARLVKDGYNVAALYRSAIPNTKFSEKVNWVKGDILDIIFLEEALADFDEIYHCAAIVSFNPRDKEEMFLTNVNGTANMVNAALSVGVSRFCYVSSVAALGEGVNNGIINELIDYNTQRFTSNYGLSKFLAEKEVWRSIGEGLNAVIINPSIILGAGNWTKGSTAIFKSAFESFPWYAEGVTGFVDVNDVVKAMTMLMAHNITGERFIIGGENMSYKEVFTSIANVFAKNPPYKKVTRFIASIIWRLEVLKYKMTGKEPLVTKETAHDALAVNRYNSDKLQKQFPDFTFTPLSETVKRVCGELKLLYHLN